ncbi:hypothetical protein F7725_023244 [Dissostichus mawsoni]|uniref:Uncharacterized protein n=1 Tax=Dissostichus mawsoni TaxID=36200 RepID=A0A7J5Z2B0_DISMA|nr:hypothetical protein F7725_023244 [Dissostichus mawsoni]
MEDKLNGFPVVSPEYLQQWVQSAQQFQALQAHQAQYSGYDHNQQSHYPEGPNGEAAMAHMAYPEPMMEEQEPEHIAKPPPKKRGRAAQPKEPKAPKPPKVPKAPKEPKPPKDPKAPKAKPGPKPKKGAEVSADGKQEKIDESFKKVKRKHDRFKGMSEEEVMTKTLPDLLDYNLDYVIVRFPAQIFARKCLFLSGFTKELLNHTSDTILPVKYKMGFTNMVARATPGSKDLSTKEFREGGQILVEKLRKYKPLLLLFLMENMFGKKPKKLDFGLQPHKIPDCEVDKVHFYIKLRELRDELKGLQKSKEIEEIDYRFDLKLAKEDAKKAAIKEEQYDPGYEDAYGGAYGEQGPDGEPLPPPTNGHCTFSTAENTEGAQEATTSQIPEGQLPDGQWMTQSFADQIPDISGGPKDAAAQ